jgi:hypothetical protein
MEFFLLDFLGKPVWMWATFLGIVVALLVFDLGVLHRDNHIIGVKESLLMSAGYVALGLLFGVWVWSELGPELGMAYMTGFVVEKTLAMDNVFVIAMIFTYFAIPPQYQHRVLFCRVPDLHRHKNVHDGGQEVRRRGQPAGLLDEAAVERDRHAPRRTLLRPPTRQGRQ